MKKSALILCTGLIIAAGPAAADTGAASAAETSASIPPGSPVQIGPDAAQITAPTAARPSGPVVAGYKLGPGDQVRISEFNTPSLQIDQKVSADGQINMPLVGDLHAGGMTGEQLARAVEAKLKEGYVLEPRVSVTIVEYRPFYVMGEVAKPGAYPYQAELNLASAVAAAGGFNSDAARGSVYLRRAGALSEEKVSVNQATPLQPGDTVRVGRSGMANIRNLPLGLLGLIH